MAKSPDRLKEAANSSRAPTCVDCFPEGTIKLTTHGEQEVFPR